MCPRAKMGCHEVGCFLHDHGGFSVLTWPAVSLMPVSSSLRPLLLCMLCKKQMKERTVFLHEVSCPFIILCVIKQRDKSRMKDF